MENRVTKILVDFEQDIERDDERIKFGPLKLSGFFGIGRNVNLKHHCLCLGVPEVGDILHLLFLSFNTKERINDVKIIHCFRDEHDANEFLEELRISGFKKTMRFTETGSLIVFEKDLDDLDEKFTAISLIAGEFKGWIENNEFD